MSIFYQTDWAKGKRSTPVGNAGVLLAETFEFNLSAALGLNNVIELGVLPGNARIVDAIIDCDDLDTNGAPTIALDVGLMSGNVGEVNLARTVGTELFAADTSARTGGMARTSRQQRTAFVATDRSIGAKVVTAPATGAAAGKIRLTVFYVQ